MNYSECKGGHPVWFCPPSTIAVYYCKVLPRCVGRLCNSVVATTENSLVAAPTLQLYLAWHHHLTTQH